MLAKFTEIKTSYDSLYNHMLAAGRIPMKETELGYWGISTADDVYNLFSTLKLNKFKSFIDLGSGDGKVALIASLFTKATGIECDDELIQHSETMKSKVKAKKVRFIKGDFMSHNLSDYDFIFINPDKHMHALEPKLFKELKGKFVVYGPHYHPKLLTKEMNFIAHTTPVTVYRNVK
jgi:protein-L-isoaspartate O-methyltransferase